MGFRWQK